MRARIVVISLLVFALIGTQFLTLPAFADTSSTPTPAPPSPAVLVYRDQAVQLDAPASVVVQFDKTQAVNVTAIGRLQSERTIIIKDNEIFWNTTFSDVWELEIDINYPAPHNQTIQIGYWSNGKLLSSPDVSASQAHIVLLLQVTTSPPVQYPTPDQVASQVIFQLKDQLTQYTDALNYSIITLNANNREMWTIVISNVAVSVFALVAVLIDIRVGNRRRAR